MDRTRPSGGCNRSSTLLGSASHMKHTSLVHLIFEALAVKRVRRTGWQILGDNDESLGEHTFMTAVIAYLLAREVQESESAVGIDMEKVLCMSIFHDFHEARTGEVDKIALSYITRDQNRANRDIFSGVDDRILKTVQEYEGKKSREARIVYEANILALLVECKHLVEKGNTNAREWLEGNAKRVRLPQSKSLARDIISGNTQSWWKDVRDRLHEEFSR